MANRKREKITQALDCYEFEYPCNCCAMMLTERKGTVERTEEENRSVDVGQPGKTGHWEKRPRTTQTVVKYCVLLWFLSVFG